MIIQPLRVGLASLPESMITQENMSKAVEYLLVILSVL